MAKVKFLYILFFFSKNILQNKKQAGSLRSQEFKSQVLNRTGFAPSRKTVFALNSLNVIKFIILGCFLFTSFVDLKDFLKSLSLLGIAFGCPSYFFPLTEPQQITEGKIFHPSSFILYTLYFHKTPSWFNSLLIFKDLTGEPPVIRERKRMKAKE